MTPLENLLDAARVEVRGTHKQHEVTLCCPFCETRGWTEDVSFHLGLNTFNGKAHCFRCNWKGSNMLYTAQQLRYVYKIEFELPKEARLRTPKEKSREPEDLKSISLPVEYERLCEDEDFVGRRVRRYLKSRGVSLLQIVKHRIGYAAAGKYAWRAMFPVLARDGKIYGCVGRAVSGQEPKYLNTPGLKMLWNTERIEPTAVLVEGVMDALRVENALLQTTGIAAVARLGSTITHVQLEQLREYDKVIVFPDFDLAGLRGAGELADQLNAAGIRISVITPETASGVDPGGMSDEEILSYLKSARDWSVGSEHRLRLAASRRVR